MIYEMKNIKRLTFIFTLLFGLSLHANFFCTHNKKFATGLSLLAFSALHGPDLNNWIKKLATTEIKNNYQRYYGFQRPGEETYFPITDNFDLTQSHIDCNKHILFSILIKFGIPFGVYKFIRSCS